MRSTPETLWAGILTVLGGAYLLGPLLVLWMKRAPRQTDPWDPEMEVAVRQPDAVPICHTCLSPQIPPAWFCPNCGAAVGRYNNCLPYVNVFSIGEVFDAGARRRVPASAVTIIGFVLASIAEYTIFAPVYGVRLWQNLTKLRNETPTVAADP